MPISLLGAGSLLLGGLQTWQGLKGLSELHKKKVPSYAETPEMKASRMRAEELAKGGYSPAEKAAFEQKLARSQNTAYQKGRDVAPGMAQELLAGINYTNTGAMNDFAASDAALHRQNIKYADSFARELQDISNMNIQEQLKQRMAAEQALGGAASSGLTQIASTLNLNQILNSDLYKDKKQDIGSDITDPFGYDKILKSSNFTGTDNYGING